MNPDWTAVALCGIGAWMLAISNNALGVPADPLAILGALSFLGIAISSIFGPRA